eukprot:3502628-Rhodomonas_salina.2
MFPGTNYGYHQLGGAGRSYARDAGHFLHFGPFALLLARFEAKSSTISRFSVSRLEFDGAEAGSILRVTVTIVTIARFKKTVSIIRASGTGGVPTNMNS